MTLPHTNTGTQWQLFQRASIVEHASPVTQGIIPGFNVLVVPDIGHKSKSASIAGYIANLALLLRHVDEHCHILEYRYDVGDQFAWTRLAEHGEILRDCLIDAGSQYHVRTLFRTAHGQLLINEAALSIIHEQYYHRAFQKIGALVQGLIFLGTPHPLYTKQDQVERLDALLLATMNLSRSMLARIREEVGFMWNISSGFELVDYEHPVISTYELLPTTYKPSLLRSKQEVVRDHTFVEVMLTIELINEDLATTNARYEQVVGVNVDHRHIFNVMMQSEVEIAITKLVVSLKGTTRGASVELPSKPSESHDITAQLDQMWLSTPAQSRADPAENPFLQPRQQSQPTSSRVTSPGQATAGSSNAAAGYEFLPVKQHAVTTVPAVKLPCYVMRQHTKVGECFGRNDILLMLEQTLLPAESVRSSASREMQSFAICGLGGLGKTQIAIEFALTQKKHFDAIFFVYADSETKLAESFNCIAEELGLAEKAQMENSAINRDRVLQWLNEPLKYERNQDTEDMLMAGNSYAEYLLIFDNADEPELLSEYWPMAGTGSVLLTSRDPLAKSRLYANKGIDLEPINATNGAELLCFLTGEEEETSRRSAAEISTRLGGLPLALHQVAGLIQRKLLTLSEFLEQYQEPSFQQDLHHHRERGFRNNYAKMLFDVWTFDNLQPASVQLLEHCALLDPDRISESIFMPSDKGTGNNLFSTTRAFHIARTDLSKSSLVTRFKAVPILAIHRVLQDSVRIRMSDDHFCGTFRSVVNLLIAAWPSQTLAYAFEPALWNEYANILPHILHLVKLLTRANPFVNDIEEANKFLDLLLKAGWYQHERGNYEDALSIFEHATQISSPFGEEMAKLSADLDFCITNTTSMTKEWDKRAYHVHRNTTYREAHPEDAFNLGIAYNEMSYYYNEQGKFEDAVKYGLQALEVFQELEMYKSNRLMPMNPRLNIANAYYFLGDATQAERWVTECYERLLTGPREWDMNANRTGNTLYVLGNVKSLQGKSEESFELHQKALNHYRTTLGEVHANTLKAYVKVAGHHINRGEYDSAIHHLDTALAGWSDIPYFDPEKARALNKKAHALELNGQSIKAAGLRINAETTWRQWYQMAHSEAKPEEPATIDYDSKIPFWAR